MPKKIQKKSQQDLSNEEKFDSSFSDKEKETEKKNSDKNFYIRLILSTIAVTTIFVNTIFGFLFPDKHVDCMEDLLFDWTESLNNFFAANVYYKNLLLIIASLSLDLSELYLIFIWIFCGKSYRFCASLSIFYALRSFIQVIYFNFFIILIFRCFSL